MLPASEHRWLFTVPGLDPSAGDDERIRILRKKAWPVAELGLPRRLWSGRTIYVTDDRAHGPLSPFMAHRLAPLAANRHPVGRWRIPPEFLVYTHHRPSDQLTGWLGYEAWPEDVRDIYAEAARHRRDHRRGMGPGLYELVGHGLGGDDDLNVDGRPMTPQLIRLDESPADAFLAGALSVTFDVMVDRCFQLNRLLGWSGIVWVREDGHRQAVQVSRLEPLMRALAALHPQPQDTPS